MNRVIQFNQNGPSFNGFFCLIRTKPNLDKPHLFGNILNNIILTFVHLLGLSSITSGQSALL